MRRLFPRISVSTRLIGLFDELEVAGGELSSIEERRLVEAAVRSAPDAGVRIVTTSCHLQDNWFSHWHAPQRTAVSSLYEWDQTATVSLQAFVAYEILLYGLHALSPGYDLRSIAHEDTRGCLFDFCGIRPDIEIKLQTMDLCGECERQLRRLHIDLDAVREVCEEVRELARPVTPTVRPGWEQRDGL